MVRGAADGEEFNLKVFYNSEYISEQALPHFIADRIGPHFGAKHAMNDVGAIRVRQGAVPPGLFISAPRTQRLTRWANECRPVGAAIA